MLKIANLQKSYHRRCVLEEIDLYLPGNRSLGLIGANGEGKTTLFKCLLNTCEIDHGNIEINGIAHTDPKSRTNLVYLPEHFQAPYYLSGKAFLNFMLNMLNSPYRPKLIESILERLLFDLNALSRPVRSYSKGMMQKLGLSFCLASGKSLLLLDEPMSGLDPAARHALKHLLHEQKQQGKSLLFSTHLLQDVEALCDDIVILANRKIQFSGSLDKALKTFDATTLEQAYLNCLKVAGNSRPPAQPLTSHAIL